MTLAYIGLGSNLKQPEKQVSQAFLALNRIPETTTVAQSSLYRNKAIGPVVQADYINAVALLNASLSADVLLNHLHRIEKSHGRTHEGVRWGPRTLDLDLLLFGQQQIHEGGLNVPHPELAKRSFVLGPLFEISPDLNILDLGMVRDLFDMIGASDLGKI